MGASELGVSADVSNIKKIIRYYGYAPHPLRSPVPNSRQQEDRRRRLSVAEPLRGPLADVTPTWRPIPTIAVGLFAIPGRCNGLPLLDNAVSPAYLTAGQQKS